MEVRYNVQIPLQISSFLYSNNFLVSSKVELQMKLGRHKPGRNHAQILVSYAYKFTKLI